MSFISYAQNFEDVMLWRALKNVKNGFYIDIGANDPVDCSVTKAMYDLGWHGLNIEPVAYWFNKLEEARVRDINVNIAIGKQEDTLEFYEVVGSGLSTLDKGIALSHAKKLGFEVKNYTVQVKPLTVLCKEKKIETIHFLKIDVEGAEKLVLEGIDFNIIRPWIILVEATNPMSQEVNFEEWEELITSKNYHFVYFDGLNRFYIADEQSQLDIYFKTPPNVFDNFILPSQIDLDKKIKEVNHWWRKATQAEEKAKQAEAKMAEAEERATQAEEKAKQAETSYHTLLDSTSWKTTKPYQYIGDRYKWFKANVKAWITFAPGSRPRRISKRILLASKCYVYRHPKLKTTLLRILNQFPSLKAHLKQVDFHQSINLSSQSYIDPSNLSYRSQDIYNKLTKKLENTI